MKYLFRDWDKIKRCLGKKKILLFLDYDGTLTSIVRNPGKANISKKTRNLLHKLSRCPKYKIAIISGRALKDIKKKVGVRGIIYAGNHGLELEGPKIKFESSIPKGFIRLLNQVRDKLKVRLASFKGIIIEDKTLTLSIHYRKVARRLLPAVKAVLRETLMLSAVKNELSIKSGKMVWEIRPPVKWNKGKIVEWLLARQKIFPIYVGDDVTDEDAFRVLRDKGLTVYVGSARHPSCAKYHLRNTAEVSGLLERLLDLQKKGRPCQN